MMARLILVLLASCASVASGQPAEALRLPKYESRYYVVYTDLPRDAAREAALRMTRMAEEYQARTADFAGSIKGRMPFFLHADRAGYLANGGEESTAGYFDGSKLVAFSAGGDEPDLRTWNTVQHEGFHQFAHKVMGQTMPSWIDEGLAEYFGEAIFTGDGYVSGVIPEWRAKRIRERLASGSFAPTTELIRWDLREWNSRMNVANYDHAWSMVQFLAHAEGGRYRKAFAGYINEVAQGRPKDRAWATQFGPVEPFEQAWRKFWLDLPPGSTDRLYLRAWTEMLTSYLARAASQKQAFGSFEAFLAAVENGEIKHHPDDWLPPTLAATAVERVGAERARLGVRWSIGAGGKLPTIVCAFPDGTRLTGRFTLAGQRVGRVSVE